MKMDRRTLLAGSVAAPLMSAPIRAAAQETVAAWPAPEHLDLWPGRPPGSPARLSVESSLTDGQRPELRARGVATPTLSVFRPKQPNGTAVLSIPGGGYGFVSVENEGINVAKALNPGGVTVFVLTYRLPAEGWANRADVPLQDAQRAMRLIRANAGRWAIDPQKLGIVGFSAGGHLAASLSVGYDDRVYPPVDAADRQSAKPRFSGLIYPVINLSAQTTHGGSRDNLLGPSPTAATRARYDTDRRVDADTPPLFLVHAIDDTVVPLENSLAMLAAARAAKVPVEAHFYESGGHGFGTALGRPDHPAAGWTDIFARWMARHIG